MRFKFTDSSGNVRTCDERCETATEDVCTCRCGGANHGSSIDSNDPETLKTRQKKLQESIKTVIKEGGSVQSSLFSIFPDTFKAKKSKKRTKKEKEFTLYNKLKQMYEERTQMKRMDEKKAQMDAELANAKFVDVKTLAGYEKEFEYYKYFCRWCYRKKKPSELGEIKLITDGENIGWKIVLGSTSGEYYELVPKDRVTKAWIYAECLECGYQWALWKLRNNSSNLEMSYPELVGKRESYQGDMYA